MVPIVIKLFPAAGSISIFKNLGLSFQSMSAKFPMVLIVSLSPITAVNKPCALVVTFRTSMYSDEPLADTFKILNFKVMSCDAITVLFVVLATP